MTSNSIATVSLYKGLYCLQRTKVHYGLCYLPIVTLVVLVNLRIDKLQVSTDRNSLTGVA